MTSRTLEKLTGHTEGHDHFHAYDENGKRLGSFMVTPEIRDRQRAHRKQVAQRWRQWWQNHQKANTRERGVVASRGGSVLEMYILPEPGKQDWPGLGSDEIAQYKENFQTESPWTGSIRGDDYQWAILNEDVEHNGFITEIYDGQRYAEHYGGKRFVLHAARSAYALSPDGSWGLKNASVQDDHSGRPAILLEFDSAGAEKFHSLTKNNIERRLGILIDGRVVTAPRILTASSRQVLITGNFRNDKAEEIVSELKKGMPPVTFELKEIEEQVAIPITQIPAPIKIHRFEPGDVVEISVFELYKEGQQAVFKRQVSEDGMISIPGLANPFRAEGMSWNQLRETIIQLYKQEKILANSFVEIQNVKSSSPQAAGKVEHVSFPKDMKITDTLRIMSSMFEKNIIYSEKVIESHGLIGFTDLYDVTFEETLQAICGSNYKYIIDGNLIRVYTKDEYDAGDEFLKLIDEKVIELKLELTDLEQKHGSNHRKVVEAKKKIEALEELKDSELYAENANDAEK